MTRTWADFMEPTITERVPLVEIARWWADVWEWRTALVEAGLGTPYDGDPGYRCPRSMVRAKFTFLSLDDEIALAPLARAEGLRRGFMTRGGRFKGRLRHSGEVW
jgi:hypothetical protein